MRLSSTLPVSECLFAMNKKWYNRLIIERIIRIREEIQTQRLFSCDVLGRVFGRHLSIWALSPNIAPMVVSCPGDRLSIVLSASPDLRKTSHLEGERFSQMKQNLLTNQ